MYDINLLIDQEKEFVPKNPFNAIETPSDNRSTLLLALNSLGRFKTWPLSSSCWINDENAARRGLIKSYGVEGIVYAIIRLQRPPLSAILAATPNHKA